VRCNVCAAAGLEVPVYRSSSAVSITSLCDVLARPTEVYFCRACGHLQTPELPDLAAYYDEQYKILVESEEEDQLYDIGPQGKVFRADHQLSTLLAKVPLAQGANVLDYGCAKGSTLRRLMQLRPDLRPHLFDVSRMYVKFWDRFAPKENQATHEVPAEWAGKFDLVTSFYSLEHVAAPGEIAAKIAKLLQPGGVFYAIVPDTYQNVGDFVVADHVNHFSPASFARLLADAGLAVREIDTRAQKSAMVAVAVKAPIGTSSRFETAPGSDLEPRVQEISKYWRGFGESVRRFEADHAGVRKAAIYGSGFYGTFVASCLDDLDRVVAFVDQNPFRQGQTLLGKPVVAPHDLPRDVELVYVGLNPAAARAEMAKLTSWSERKLEHWFP
jgi:SAM-dependent methyltransferase